MKAMSTSASLVDACMDRGPAPIHWFSCKAFNNFF